MKRDQLPRLLADPSWLNQSDFVTYDNATREIVRISSAKGPRPQAQIGQTVVSGMSACWHGCWQAQTERQALDAAILTTTQGA